MDKRELRAVVERVVSYAAGRVPFDMELRSFTVEHGLIIAVFVVNGRELDFTTTAVDSTLSVARMLAVEAGWYAGDMRREFNVPNLLEQWWRAEAGYGMEDFRDASFSVEAVGEKLDAVREHVMATVEADVEHYKNLLKLAEVLRAYPDRVKPTEFGQIMQGMVETAVVSENGTWFVETEDFVGEGAWHPEAWSEFLEDLDALRSWFGADMVDNLIAVVPGFDPTDEATWPDDGIAATFYGDFLKLFDTADLEA